MRQFETMIVLPPNLGEEEMEKVVGTVETELNDRFGCRNVVVNRWGKKTLAYPIQKFSEGYYVLYEYESEKGDHVTPLQSRLKINENVMRFLTIRRDEERKTEASLKARFARRKKFTSDGTLTKEDETSRDEGRD